MICSISSVASLFLSDTIRLGAVGQIQKPPVLVGSQAVGDLVQNMICTVTCRYPGHLHLGLRKGRNHCEGAGRGSGRLPGQALLDHGARGKDTDVAARAGRSRTVPAGQTGNQLPSAPGERSRRPGRARREEVRPTGVLLLNAGRVSTFDAMIRQVWGPNGLANHKLVRRLVKTSAARSETSLALPITSSTFEESGTAWRGRTISKWSPGNGKSLRIRSARPRDAFMESVFAQSREWR